MKVIQCRYCFYPNVWYDELHDDKGNKSSGFVCGKCGKSNDMVSKPEAQGHPTGCMCDICTASRLFREPVGTCVRCKKVLPHGTSVIVTRTGGPYCTECAKEDGIR